MTPLQNSVNPPISLVEKREELRRILESKRFAGAPKKTRFLQFVAEQTFAGNGDNLNEYLIGLDVYERGSDFNPQKDPIVRVQAHEIRRLLKKYYEEDGKDSPIRVELPSGHYVLVFGRQASEAPAEAERTVELPAAKPLPSKTPQPRSRMLFALTLAFAATSLVLALLLAARIGGGGKAGQPPAAASLPEGLEWFWRSFLPPAAPPLIVIPNHPLLRAAHDGDSPQTLENSYEIPKDRLPEFRDTIHFRELKRFRFVPSLTDFTSVGETLGLLNLSDLLAGAGQKVRVQPSRLVNLDEIKGDNAILLGGNQAWSGRVFLNAEGFHFQSGVILNNHPRPGEQPVYKPEFDPVTNQLRRDYALVLMLPNESKEQRVLLVYGIYTQGSQAAIKYITNPERMLELRQALTDASSDHKSLPPYFQALLSTTVENSVPGDTSLVAVRVVSK